MKRSFLPFVGNALEACKKASTDIPSIHPYRYYRQKHTTVMAQVPHGFVKDILWPEFSELNETLRKYLDEVTERIIAESVCPDNSEAEVLNDSQKTLTE
jgi:tRNA nucleotidyltransferase (CCA-adding enzyme)